MIIIYNIIYTLPYRWLAARGHYILWYMFVVHIIILYIRTNRRVPIYTLLHTYVHSNRINIYIYEQHTTLYTHEWYRNPRENTIQYNMNLRLYRRKPSPDDSRMRVITDSRRTIYIIHNIWYMYIISVTLTHTYVGRQDVLHIYIYIGIGR